MLVIFCKNVEKRSLESIPSSFMLIFREMMTMKDLKMTMIDSTVDPHAVVHTTVTTTHSGASGEALGEGTEGDTGAHQGT